MKCNFLHIICPHQTPAKRKGSSDQCRLDKQCIGAKVCYYPKSECLQKEERFYIGEAGQECKSMMCGAKEFLPNGHKCHVDLLCAKLDNEAMINKLKNGTMRYTILPQFRKKQEFEQGELL